MKKQIANSVMHSHQLKHTHTRTSSDSSCTCFDKSSFICRSRVVCNISLFSDEVQTRSLLPHRDVHREAIPNNTLTTADLSKAPFCFLIVFVVGLLTMHASFGTVIAVLEGTAEEHFDSIIESIRNHSIIQT